MNNLLYKYWKGGWKAYLATLRWREGAQRFLRHDPTYKSFF